MATRGICPWCKDDLPVEGPRYVHMLDPVPASGNPDVPTPLPRRVCSPTCPERPPGIEVYDFDEVLAAMR